ncbi:MAG: tRNA pseudouridine(55) synthase TruB [Acidimicrobiia bacterium]|nr:MAG: tRNA pseudouridine(55) synthase TruB [Acidimicrobiia bacterium]
MTEHKATGFLLIDKPKAWTSHDVVAKVRSRVGGKVGHAGTLDPMATGLLVLGIGSATRLLRFVQGCNKEYVATALFGVATDSLDADGAILSRDPLPVTSEEVEFAMERFRGEILQVPPMVSARKVEGRRLYELAREGKVIEREARPVMIHRFELVDLAPSDYPEVTLRTVCSTGTYMRTLADDLARALGGRAHLTALRRVRIGALSVSDAVSVDEAVDAAEANDIERVLVTPAVVLADLPEIRVDDAMIAAVRNGREIPEILMPDGVDPDSSIRIGDRHGELIAVYRRDRTALRPEVVLS